MTAITLKEAALLRCDLPLVRPFRTSFGVQEAREAVLLRVVVVDGAGSESFGWGECVAMRQPLYSEEWAAGAWALIRDVLIPMVAARPLTGIQDVAIRLAGVRGNRMAKATVEMAIVDAALRAGGSSVKAWLGGTRDRVECGVSIGIAPTTGALIDQIAGYLSQGYRRIKCKIEPGNDVDLIRAVRTAYPGVMLTADANAAYSIADAPTLAALDEFKLAMLEQPLAEDAVDDHAELARRIATPICLDETITSAAAARNAIAAHACMIVNIKQGRLGGLTEARRTHDACAGLDIPVWCGGMLETGVGRAANLALASLPGFTLPGDTSASSRYFHEDLTEPFAMGRDGTIAVPDRPGLGVEPLPDRLRSTTVAHERIAL